MTAAARAAMLPMTDVKRPMPSSPTVADAKKEAVPCVRACPETDDLKELFRA
jgi:hypothetical protein